MQQLQRSRAYSYTSQTGRQLIFVACCFKHVTGRIVSRDGLGKPQREVSLSRARTHFTCIPADEPQTPLHAAEYYDLHSPILAGAESCPRRLVRRLPSHRIGRVEPAKGRATTMDAWRRGTPAHSLRGTEPPQLQPGRCAFRLEVLGYQRLPRSPRSPPRPPPPPWPPRPPPPPPCPPRPPPYPPRPPPPPPPRSACGRASFTTRLRPPKSCPLIRSTPRSPPSS